jgi:hypothetical protein
VKTPEHRIDCHTVCQDADRWPSCNTSIQVASSIDHKQLMLVPLRGREKTHSTLVAVQETTRKPNFCRRVDMEKFATKFSLTHACDGKTSLENRPRNRRRVGAEGIERARARVSMGVS